MRSQRISSIASNSMEIKKNKVVTGKEGNGMLACESIWVKRKLTKL